MQERLSSDEAMLVARPIEDLTDEELDRWMWACRRLAKLDVSWYRRWRWRRRLRRGVRVSMDRTNVRLGAGPPLCERCRQRPPSVHIVYGHGNNERYGHFCAECSKLEPPGRFGRMEVRT